MQKVPVDAKTVVGYAASYAVCTSTYTCTGARLCTTCLCATSMD